LAKCIEKTWSSSPSPLTPPGDVNVCSDGGVGTVVARCEIRRE
jgi:hypothetical protein